MLNLSRMSDPGNASMDSSAFTDSYISTNFTTGTVPTGTDTHVKTAFILAPECTQFKTSLLNARRHYLHMGMPQTSLPHSPLSKMGGSVDLFASSMNCSSTPQMVSSSVRRVRRNTKYRWSLTSILQRQVSKRRRMESLRDLGEYEGDCWEFFVSLFSLEIYSN